MNRKIEWESGVLDEIELVYGKAENDENIGKMLEQLEEKALNEARENCGLLKMADGGSITPEQFDMLSGSNKEGAIWTLARIGLAGIGQDMQSATIFIKLSARIQRVMACTVFDILNRLEKLDGALNAFVTKWTLEIQTPLGGKKGLMQWEMLIMMLYPWISVREVSTNEVAETMVDQNTASSGRPVTARVKETSAQASASKPGDTAPEHDEKDQAPEKKSFWKRLFGK